MSNVELYRQMHSQGHFPGHSTKKYSGIIKGLVQKYDAKTLLDFGSGKGMQYDEQKLHEEWGIPKPTLYDPAVKGIESLPNALRPFDGVICCDVLEHLAGKELAAAVFDASIRAKKFVFFAISTRAAKKTLPDGRNAHLTIQSPDWWQGFVTSLAFGGPEIVLNFDPGG